MIDLIKYIPWQGLLFPLGVLFLVWLGFKGFDCLLALVRSVFKRGRSRLRLVLLFLLCGGSAFGQAVEAIEPVVSVDGVTVLYMVWGFGSAVAVFSALFVFRIAYKSIFRGLDLIERD